MYKTGFKKLMHISLEQPYFNTVRLKVPVEQMNGTTEEKNPLWQRDKGLTKRTQICISGASLLSIRKRVIRSNEIRDRKYKNFLDPSVQGGDTGLYFFTL